MRKSLRFVNPLLGLVAALIAAALVKTWVAPVEPVPGPSVTKPLQEAEALAYNPTARPPLAQFDSLLEKNPFKQPPPMPARPAGASAPPPSLPTLVGTILVDHERRAILSDKGKSSFYSVGQAVAGGVIAEIKEDRIIFKRSDTTQEIRLKGTIESAVAAPAQALESAPSQIPAVASPTASSPSPMASPRVESVPGAPPASLNVPDFEEMKRRQEEMLQRMQELRERHKGMQRDR